MSFTERVFALIQRDFKVENAHQLDDGWLVSLRDATTIYPPMFGVTLGLALGNAYLIVPKEIRDVCRERYLASQRAAPVIKTSRIKASKITLADL